MKRKNTPTLLFIVIVLLTLSCRLTPKETPTPTVAVPEPTPEATATQAPTPTIVLPTPTTAPAATEVIQPTEEPEPAVNLISVDMGNGFYLTYNPEVWDVEGRQGWSNLVLKDFNACKIIYLAGHGMDMNVFKVESKDEVLGGKLANVSYWTRISDGSMVLISFHFGDDYLSVEGPNAETLPENCIRETYQVISQSAEKDFTY